MEKERAQRLVGTRHTALLYRVPCWRSGIARTRGISRRAHSRRAGVLVRPEHSYASLRSQFCLCARRQLSSGNRQRGSFLRFARVKTMRVPPMTTAVPYRAALDDRRRC